MSFKVCVSLLIFCLVHLSIGVSEVLKSPTIIVLLLISPFIFVSICLTYWGAPMSLLFIMLPSLVIVFLPRSKRILISWLISPSTLIWEPKKIKFFHCFHCLRIYGTRCHDIRFLTVEFQASFFTLLFHLHQEAL